jgi:hypothetical protein
MLVVATNQPEQFDWAVNDRLHELVKFDLPSLFLPYFFPSSKIKYLNSDDLERERILLQYFFEFIAEPATSGSRRQRLKLADFDWVKKVKAIVPQTKGMSGRELSNMVLGWQVKILSNNFLPKKNKKNNSATKIKKILSQKLRKKNNTATKINIFLDKKFEKKKLN